MTSDVWHRFSRPIFYDIKEAGATWLGINFSLSYANVKPFTTVEKELLSQELFQVKLTQPYTWLSIAELDFGVLWPPNWSTVGLLTTEHPENAIEFAAANMHYGNITHKVNPSTRLDWLRLAAYHNSGFTSVEEVPPQDRATKWWGKAYPYMLDTSAYWDICTDLLR